MKKVIITNLVDWGLKQFEYKVKDAAQEGVVRNRLDQIIRDFQIVFKINDEGEECLFCYHDFKTFLKEHLERLSDIVALLKLESEEKKEIQSFGIKCKSINKRSGNQHFAYKDIFGLYFKFADKSVRIVALANKNHGVIDLTTIRKSTMFKSLLAAKEYIDNVGVRD